MLIFRGPPQFSMSSDSNKTLDILPDGMQVRSEEIGFAADDLFSCPTCTRRNSPDRIACIYCGATLLRAELSALNVADSDVLETWENGFNVAFRSAVNKLPENSVVMLARLLRLDQTTLESVLQANTFLPLARLRDEASADGFIAGLNELGISGISVTDTDIAAERPPVRLRAIEFDNDSCTFVDFNTGSRVAVSADDVRLVVMGSKIESRSETTWKKKRGSNEMVDEVLLDSDQPLIDIYRASDDLGFRVQLNGFDFRALGSAKSLLAGENMKLLAELLGGSSEKTRVDRSYMQSRPLLDRVWELESETDHMGPLRAGFEKRKKTKISVMNNLRQFTKYSRLQRLSI
jgi:hypothetical protein